MFDDLKFKIQEKWTDFIGNQFFENLRVRYESLPSREQRLLKMSGAGLTLFIIIYIFYSMIVGVLHKEEFINESGTASQKLDELNDYISANDFILKKKKKTTATKYASLYDIVDQHEIAARIKPESRVEIKEQPHKDVKNTKFSESTATVKYSNITLRQLKDLLLGIETDDIPCKIPSLKVTRRSDDVRYLDVEFEILSRTPNK